MKSCLEKIKCPICEREITKINLSKHLRAHEKGNIKNNRGHYTYLFNNSLNDELIIDYEPNFIGQANCLLCGKEINETDELVRQIKAAMEEQNQGSLQINDALHAMNDSTVEVRNASQEMALGNKAILDGVSILQDATGVMKKSMETMSDSADKITETGNSLSDISQKMRDSISEIGEQINQFKV